MKLTITTKLSFLVLVLSLTLQSCVVIRIPKDEQIVDLLNEEICSGELYGVGEEGLEAQTIIIETQDELEKLLDHMSKVNPTRCSDILLTTDFSQYDLIFILDQVRGTGDYDVMVLSVSRQGDLVTVKYSKKSPSGAAPTVMTQPYCFQQVEKLNSEVRFELSE